MNKIMLESVYIPGAPKLLTDKHILNLNLSALPNNASYFTYGYSIAVHCVCWCLLVPALFHQYMKSIQFINVMASNYTTNS